MHNSWNRAGWVIILASLCTAAVTNRATAKDGTPCRVSVQADRVLRTVDRKFFGVNSLFWIEDDAARANSQITKNLRELPCGLMRFPGGTVADNYHWKTNRLDDPKAFPKSDGPATTDTDEFIAWCRQIGAEPILVVNVDSSYLAGDVEAGIREAAEWVEYCNRTKDYRVRFWEIGNEEYLNCPRWPMTAREYAETVVRFSRAMKKVDPSIKIGAVGTTWAEEAVLMDRLPAAERTRFRALSVDARKEETTRLRPLVKRNPGDRWWPTVISAAGKDFDFAVIHVYEGVGTFAKFSAESLTTGEQIAALDRLFRKTLPNRPIPLAMTEWNLRHTGETQGIGNALALAELLGNCLHGGVYMANFWPLRMQSQNICTLLNYKTGKPLPAYQMLHMFASNFGPEMVACQSSVPQVYVVASRSAEGVNLFLVNKSLQATPREVEIRLNGRGVKKAVATSLTGVKPDADQFSTSSPAIALQGDNWVCKLPPYSLTLIRLQ